VLASYKTHSCNNYTQQQQLQLTTIAQQQTTNNNNNNNPDSLGGSVVPWLPLQNLLKSDKFPAFLRA